jgi:hypothetical protein
MPAGEDAVLSRGTASSVIRTMPKVGFASDRMGGRRRLFVLALSLVTGLVVAGCESREAREQRLSDRDLHAAADTATAFRAEVTFCRRVSRKSGKPLGVSDEFTMADKSRVRAVVDFDNLRPERIYAVHLAWIAPSGREIFRKYAEVSLEPDSLGGYTTRIDWREAEDLVRVDEEIRQSKDANFTLISSLNTSLERQRDPGEYRLRVYLDRRLLTERSFLLNAAS